MWEQTSRDSSSDNSEYEKYMSEIQRLLGPGNLRDFQEEILGDFIDQVTRRGAIPDCLLEHVSETLEELLYGKGVSKVSDVLGPRPKDLTSTQKRKLHSKVRQTFAGHKLDGINRQENIALTAEQCGVGQRTVEEIISKQAKREPFFRY